ncbi:putative methyltransferase [Daldinia sp. FL1419]|nr:putative methyltransferase [Daldinia sp. FL1419]
MPQNNYDRQDFFENYIKLDRQVKGLEGAPEWPRLRAMLPDLNGKTVLDLGCGFGWVSRFARENGAASVLAIDISEKMLERAREATRDDKIIYEKANLEELRLPESQYDVVFSSLAFHYIENISGYYQKEGSRTTNWLAPGIQKQHRTMGTYINTILKNNLQLTDFIEWCPTEEELQEFPTRKSEMVRPTFLLLSATKC